jgi:hypothetical protein
MMFPRKPRIMIAPRVITAAMMRSSISITGN